MSETTENQQQNSNEIHDLQVKGLKAAILDIEENRQSRKQSDETQKLHQKYLEHARYTNSTLMVASIIEALSIVIIACLVAYSL